MAAFGDDYTFTEHAGPVDTTDTYATIPITDVDGNPWPDGILVAWTSGPLSVNWKNTGSNTIKYKVLGANDRTLADADWAVIVAEATLAASASVGVEINPVLYHYVKFQHAANVGSSQGASQLKGCHKRI